MASTQTGFQDQGPSFRATGKGLINKLPNFSATQENANAVLINKSFDPDSKYGRLWLFCTGVFTGWHVSGSFGQSVSSRFFYPRTLIQDEMQIRCSVASQYQYDLMVEFIQKHHQSAINSVSNVATMVSTGGSGGIPIEFKLFGHKIPVGKNRAGATIYKVIHDPVHYEGFIHTVESGHDHLTNAPSFTLNMKVSKDFHGQNVEKTGILNAALQKRYLDVFGVFYDPNITKMQDNFREISDNVLDNVQDIASTVSGAASDIGNTIVDFWGNVLS